MTNERAPLEPAQDRRGIRTALLVEDSVAAQEQLSRYLGELKIEVTVHPSADSALEKAQELCPDLIVLDLLLGQPSASGWQVLERLKSDPATKAIPVMVVSVMDERSRGLRLGAAEYLVKPITRRQLQEALRRVDPSVPSHAEPSSPGLPTAHERDHPPLILLAEDNESNIMTFKDYLESKGYRVVVGRDGGEAIDRAREERPDLILMDIQMPRIDGLEAIRRIRADSVLRTVPILALTALAMPGDRDRCLEVGADEYMSKPVNLAELVRTIESYVPRRKQSEPLRSDRITQP